MVVAHPPALQLDHDETARREERVRKACAVHADQEIGTRKQRDLVTRRHLAPVAASEEVHALHVAPRLSSCGRRAQVRRGRASHVVGRLGSGESNDDSARVLYNARRPRATGQNPPPQRDHPFCCGARPARSAYPPARRMPPKARRTPHC